MAAILLVTQFLIVKRTAEREAKSVGENIHQRAFGDETDRENHEFIYSYGTEFAFNVIHPHL